MTEATVQTKLSVAFTCATLHHLSEWNSCSSSLCDSRAALFLTLSFAWPSASIYLCNRVESSWVKVGWVEDRKASCNTAAQQHRQQCCRLTTPKPKRHKVCSTILEIWLQERLSAWPTVPHIKSGKDRSCGSTSIDFQLTRRLSTKLHVTASASPCVKVIYKLPTCCKSLIFVCICHVPLI